MERSEIETHLRDIIRDTQELSGMPALDIPGNICPLTNLEGFDSIRAVEVVAMLGARLNIKFDQNITFFRSKDKRQAFTLDHVVDLISDHVNR